MDETIVNRVSQSSLETLDLEKFLPSEDEMMALDFADFLFMKMILKEKDFREQLKTQDWTVYKGKQVAVFCSVDAIIPPWAYMLLVVHLQDFTNDIFLCSLSDLPYRVLDNKLLLLDPNKYIDKRIVVKGCGDKKLGEKYYMMITQKLAGVAKSIMYGEPCSTVPIYKKPKL